MNVWHVIDLQGNIRGPITLHELLALYKSNELSENSAVWNGIEIQEWTAIKNVSQITLDVNSDKTIVNISDSNEIWWTLDSEHKAIGPMTIGKLKQLFIDGGISIQSFVWNGDNVEQWTNIESLPDLSLVLQSEFNIRNVDNITDKVFNDKQVTFADDRNGRKRIASHVTGVQQINDISIKLAETIICSNFDDDGKDGWYLQGTNKQKWGPFDLKKLFHMFEEGRLTSNSYLMDVHGAKWIKLIHIQSLYQLLKRAQMKTRKKSKKPAINRENKIAGKNKIRMNHNLNRKRDSIRLLIKNAEYRAQINLIQKQLRKCSDRDCSLLDLLESVIGIQKMSQIEGKKSFHFLHSI